MPAFLLGTLLIIFFSFDLHWFPVSAAVRRVGLGRLHRSPRLRPADDHPGRHHHRLVQPLHALVDDGRHGRGLHPHGPGQGRQPTGGSSTATRLRNALIPILTLLGLSLPAIVSGALITETVFNYPGMGLPHRPGRLEQRHPPGARHHAGDHRRHGGRLAARRHPLRRGRPAHQVRGGTDGMTDDAIEDPVFGTDAGPVPDCRRASGWARPSRRSELVLGARGRRVGPAAAACSSRSPASSSRTSWPSSGCSSSCMVLFCFVGPHFYHTNQTNQQARCSTPSERAARATDTPWAPTAPASTSWAGSCTAARPRSSWGSPRPSSPPWSGCSTGPSSGFFGGWVDALP